MFSHRQLILAVVLIDNSEIRLYLGGGKRPDISTVQQNLAAVVIVEPGEELDDRGLPAPVLADERVLLSWVDGETEVMQDFPVGLGIREADMVENQTLKGRGDNAFVRNAVTSRQLFKPLKSAKVFQVQTLLRMLLQQVRELPRQGMNQTRESNDQAYIDACRHQVISDDRQKD